MSTKISISVAGNSLVDRAKQLQAAGRTAQLDKDSGKKLAQELKNDNRREPKAYGQPLANPLPQAMPRPAAQRSLDGGSIAGVDAFTFTSTSNATFRLDVGPPNRRVSVTVTTPDPSNAEPASVPGNTDISAGRDALLGYISDVGGNLEYPCGTYRGFYGSNRPLNTYVESTTGQYSINNYNDSDYYVLPIGNKSCIYVYVHSKLRVYTVNRYLSSITRASVNVRNTTFGCDGRSGTYYDRESIFYTESVLDNIEQRQVYQIFAFFVNEDSVRQLTVPAQLDAAMRRLHPPMAVNSTRTVTNSSRYTRYEYSGPNAPLNYNGPVTNGTAVIPAFDLDVHAQTKLHGNYSNVSSMNDVLAKQFGIGKLNENNHAGSGGGFFSPAIYTFLTTPMNLSVSANAQSYSYMRATYFPFAVNKYLAPCVLSGSCVERTTVAFDVSATSPTNVITAHPASNFTSTDRYTLALNGAFSYNVNYAWDGDRPAYCKQKLQLLGFSPSDLKP